MAPFSLFAPVKCLVDGAELELGVPRLRLHWVHRVRGGFRHFTRDVNSLDRQPRGFTKGNEGNKGAKQTS